MNDTIVNYFKALCPDDETRPNWVWAILNAGDLESVCQELPALLRMDAAAWLEEQK
jgi:hypothetical protein